MPPHLRNQGDDRTAALRRLVKGQLNRLNETTLPGITASLEQIYMDFPRKGKQQDGSMEGEMLSLPYWREMSGLLLRKNTHVSMFSSCEWCHSVRESGPPCSLWLRLVVLACSRRVAVYAHRYKSDRRRPGVRPFCCGAHARLTRYRTSMALSL